MAKIPTILAKQGIETRPRSGQSSVKIGNPISIARRSPVVGHVAPSFGETEGQMFAGALNKLASVTKRRDDYNNGLWVEQQTTQAQKDWLETMNKESSNPTPGLPDRIETDYKKYSDAMLDAAPSERAKNSLLTNLNNLNVRILGQGLNIEARTQSQINVTQLNSLMLNAQDVLAASSNPAADLKEQQEQLFLTIKAARAIGKIDASIANSFNESIDNLAPGLAEHLAGTDPVAAKQILDNAKSVPLNRRTVIENKIRSAKKTSDGLFRAQQVKMLKDNISQIEQTGEANPIFNMEVYTSATSKGAGHDAAVAIKGAQLYYSGKSAMEGASKSEIAAVLSAAAPKKNDNDFALKASVLADLNRKAASQVKMLDNDPFTYSQQDPVMKSLAETFADKDPETQAVMLPEIIRRSHEIQASMGVQAGLQRSMPVADAINLANTLNYAQPADVINRLNSARLQYGEFFPRVIGDVSRLPDSQKVDTSIQIAALHLDKPWVADFIQASRTPTADYTLSTDDLTDIRDELESLSDLNDFQFSLLSTSISEDRQQYASDFATAAEKFAVSLVARGEKPRKAAAIAVEAIIGEEFGFGESGEHTYAIRKKYQTKDGISSVYSDDELFKIRRGLDMFIGQGKLPWYKRQTVKFPGINPKSLDVERLNLPKKTDPEDFLTDKAFWATRPDNNGVQLYAPGDTGTAQRVYDKDGRAISLSFEQVIESYDAFEKQENPASNLRFGP